MKTEIEQLNHFRLKKQELSLTLAKARSEFEAQHKEEIDELRLVEGVVSDTEEKLRQMALMEYDKTKETKFIGGISIRINKSVDYAEEDALQWAKDNKLCLKLDASAFKKEMKEYYDKNTGQYSLPFVKEVEKPSAVLPSKLVVE